MLKYILFTTTAILVLHNANAQDETSSTKGEIFVSSVSLYYEVLGSGITNSANIEVRFGKKENGFGLRGGYGFFFIDNNAYSSVPFAVNFLLGKDRSKLELGLGVTLYSFDQEFIFDRDEHETYSLIIMYRYQPEKSGVIIRAGFTPMIGTIDNSTAFLPYIPCFSIGYKF